MFRQFDKLREVVKFDVDFWNENCEKIGERTRRYFDDTNKGKYVGAINYNLNSGEIGYLWLSYKYRNQGLGTELVTCVCNEMKEWNTKEIWLVSDKGHKFWERFTIFDKHFTYRNSIQKGLKRGGYFMRL